VLIQSRDSPLIRRPKLIGTPIEIDPLRVFTANSTSSTSLTTGVDDEAGTDQPSAYGDLVFFAGCIVAIPIVGARGHYVWVAVLIRFVLVECGVLAANRGCCPLTGMAARHTGQRSANFDIYLPVWLARYNKAIFGTQFVVGGLFVLARWWTSSVQ
jgi:hypothetical protein